MVADKKDFEISVSDVVLKGVPIVRTGIVYVLISEMWRTGIAYILISGVYTNMVAVLSKPHLLPKFQSTFYLKLTLV